LEIMTWTTDCCRSTGSGFEMQRIEDYCCVEEGSVTTTGRELLGDFLPCKETGTEETKDSMSWASEGSSTELATW
jgi:hypothetical protein